MAKKKEVIHKSKVEMTKKETSVRQKEIDKTKSEAKPEIERFGRPKDVPVKEPL